MPRSNRTFSWQEAFTEPALNYSRQQKGHSSRETFGEETQPASLNKPFFPKQQGLHPRVPAGFSPGSKTGPDREKSLESECCRKDAQPSGGKGTESLCSPLKKREGTVGCLKQGGTELGTDLSTAQRAMHPASVPTRISRASIFRTRFKA